jgi:hypothetical protein
MNRDLPNRGARPEKARDDSLRRFRVRHVADFDYVTVGIDQVDVQSGVVVELGLRTYTMWHSESLQNRLGAIRRHVPAIW